jgi:hypothetical protein
MSEKPLSNRKLEIVARQLVKGTTATEAAIAAGYPAPVLRSPQIVGNGRIVQQVKSGVAAPQAKPLRG